jgi:hypothetical protein
MILGRPSTMMLLALATVLAQKPDGYGGSEDCSCINPFVTLPYNTSDSCQGLLRTSDQSCFPITYGAQGCRRYDANPTGPTLGPTAECNVVRPPAWCNASWCFVDGANCTRPLDESLFFRSQTFTSSLAFSYEACGNVNEFSDAGRTQLLSGLALRVSFPGDSGSGYTIVTVPAGTVGIGGTQRDGSMVRFFADLMTQYNVQCECPDALQPPRRPPSSRCATPALPLSHCAPHVWLLTFGCSRSLLVAAAAYRA